MKPVAKLAVELHIGYDSILYFLKQNGFDNANINTKIPEELEVKFKKTFIQNKGNVNQALEGFSNNKFSVVKQTIQFKGKPNILSHFTDHEAILICSKMSDGKIRYYAKEYSLETVDKHKAFLKYQLHFLAMKALRFYGGHILTFVSNLKIFPGRNKKVAILNASKRKIYDAEPTLPELEFYPVGENEKCYIRFSRQIERKKMQVSFTIYNKRRKPLYSVSDKGQLITNYENRFPQITLFREYINGQKIMYSGFDNVYCDICGRELTDKLSVLYGRGPSCRDNYPL